MTHALNLDIFTQPDAMRALLQAKMPGYAEGRLRIDALGISQVRRNTSVARQACRMTLCYTLQVSEPARQRSGTQLLHAQVFRDAQAAAAAHAEHGAQQLATPAFGEALVHLPKQHLLLWALPNDPGLPQLTTLLDPARAAPVLPIAVSGPPQVALLHYLPQRRATLRYKARAAAGDAAVTLYAKTFCHDGVASIAAHFQHFWQLAQHDPAAPLVAQPLGHDATTRTLWQAPAPGLPLLQMLAGANGETDGHALVQRVAHALVRLHDTRLQPDAGATPRSAAYWLGQVRQRQQKLQRADAAWSQRAARVAHSIEQAASHLTLQSLSLIHGDFHPEQVWLHNGRVVLFDFDEFTFGDPMEDVAEFTLKLGAAGAGANLADAFAGAYAKAAPQHFDAHRLHWHLAVQQLLQASRAFIYQQPGWRVAVQRRLADCELQLAHLS